MIGGFQLKYTQTYLCVFIHFSDVVKNILLYTQYIYNLKAYKKYLMNTHKPLTYINPKDYKYIVFLEFYNVVLQCEIGSNFIFSPI